MLVEKTLTVFIGPIGSSKSSLLMALLGEMTLMKGIANVQGSKSFAARKPWIFAGSVKENVVFCRKFEKARYERTNEFYEHASWKRILRFCLKAMKPLSAKEE